MYISERDDLLPVLYVYVYIYNALFRRSSIPSLDDQLVCVRVCKKKRAREKSEAFVTVVK